ncbi:MAG: GNAT family N-acetyltransferase, partial [Gemmatimonadetes bacterium]|nr:GNAT family N-acetyltransferase [Gemmatimonadota bacterium]
MNPEDCTIRIDDETEYGPVREPSDLDVHARTLQWSFRYPIEDSRLVLERMGQEKIRLLRLRGQVVGGLSLYSVGQWFGGRRVPMAGVGVVGIAPEARGHGVATRMMDACVLDARASGHPISVLYPAKQSLYRRSGWELGGSLWNHTVPIAALPGGDRDLDVRECRPEDERAVRALHAKIACRRPGEVDRDDWFWERVMRNPRFHVRGFVVEASDGLEGYVFLHEAETEETYGYDLACTDLVAANARAARRLFRFVADHGSLG